LFVKSLRRYLVAGILVWLPIGITIILLRILIGLMDRTLILVPEQFRPEAWLGFAIPGLGLVLTVLILLVTGVSGKYCRPQPGWILGAYPRSDSSGSLRIFGLKEFCGNRFFGFRSIFQESAAHRISTQRAVWPGVSNFDKFG